MIGYSDAVNLAKAVIEDLQSTMGEMRDKIMEIQNDDMKNHPEEFIEKTKDYEEFSVACFTIANALERGDALPPPVAKWLAGYLRGEVKKPKRKQGRPNDILTPFWIVAAVNSCVHKGLKATRNDVSEPVSACDAVAEALCILNLEPTSYEGVKRVWLQSKERFSPKGPTT